LIKLESKLNVICKSLETATKYQSIKLHFKFKIRLKDSKTYVKALENPIIFNVKKKYKLSKTFAASVKHQNPKYFYKILFMLDYSLYIIAGYAKAI
jgi:hypothetical protein